MQTVRRRNRLALWIMFPVLLVTLTATLIVMATRSESFHRTVQRELRRFLPGDTIDFRRIEIGIDLSVVIHDVVVTHPDRPNEKLVTAKEIRARLAADPMTLLQGRLELTDIYLSDVSAFLEFDDLGHLSLLDAFVEKSPPDPDPEPSTFYLSLTNARIVRSDVRLAFPQFGIEVHGIDLQDFSLSMTDGVLSMEGGVSVSGGRFQTVSTDPEIAPIVVDVLGLSITGFDWKGDAFGFQKADLRLPGGRIEVEGHLSLTEMLPFKLIGKFTGAANLPVGAQFIGDLLQGDVEAHFQVEGPMLQPYGTYRLHSPELRVAAPGLNEEGVLRLKELAVLGSLERWKLKLEEVKFEAFGGAIRASGQLDLSDLPNLTYEADLDLKNIDTSMFLTAAPQARPWVAGRLDLTAHLAGAGVTPETLAVDLKIKRAELRRAGGRTPIKMPPKISLTADVRLEKQRLRVRSVALQLGPHRIAAKGSVDPSAQTMDLQLDLTTGPLAQLLAPVMPPDLKLNAAATFKGKVSGPFLNPAVEGDLELTQVDVLEYLAGEKFAGKLAVQAGRFTWTGIDSRTKLGRLGFDAAIRLWPEDGDATTILVDPPLEVTHGRISGLPLSRFLPPEVPLEGLLEATFEVSGLASDPRIETFVTSGAMDIYGERVERIRLEASYQAGEVEVPSLEVLLDKGRKVEGAGRLSLESGEFDGHLRGQGLPLHAMRHLAEAVPDLWGELSFDLRAEGDLESPRVNGKIQVEELHIAGRRLGDAYFDVGNRDDGSLFVRSENVFDHLKLFALIPVDGTRPKVTVEFSKLPVERFAPELLEFGATARLTGNLGFSLTADNEPEAFMFLQRVEATWRGMKIKNHRPGSPAYPWKFLLQDGRVVMSNIKIVHGATEIAAKGSYDLATKHVDITAKGVADADLARLAGDSIARAEGSFGVRMEIAGPTSAPTVRGAVSIAEPVTLFLRSLPGRRILVQSGLVILAPDRVFITDDEPVRGLFDDGWFTATGQVDLKDLTPTDAVLQIEAGQIEWNEPSLGLRLVANADLQFEGHKLAERGRQMVLSGLVDLVEGELRTRDDQLDVRTWVDARQEVKGTALDPNSVLAALQFRELKIVGRDSFIVDAKVNSLGFELDVQPQLNLEGTLLKPLIQGVVQANESTSVIKYSGHEFEVVRGTVEFDQNGNPVLDIRAEAEIEPRVLQRENEDGGLEVRDEKPIQHVAIIVKGLIDLSARSKRFDKLIVQFESDEGLTEFETVMLIATRYLPEDLREVSGAGGASAADIVLAPMLAAFEEIAKAQTGNIFKKLELAPQIQTGGFKVKIQADALEGHVEIGADVAANVGEEESDVEVRARVKFTDEFSFEVRTQRRSGADTGSETQGEIRYRLTIPRD